MGKYSNSAITAHSLAVWAQKEDTERKSQNHLPLDNN